MDIWWYVQATKVHRSLSLISRKGGFVGGDASRFNGTDIVGRSGELNTPIIYVSFNYRLNGMSFFLNVL